VDISSVVIEQMRVSQTGQEEQPGITYDVADCRAMPQFASGSFGGVLDKGTLDALMCDSASGCEDTLHYLQEVAR
jgi:hypothetical protein